MYDSSFVCNLKRNILNHAVVTMKKKTHLGINNFEKIYICFQEKFMGIQDTYYSTKNEFSDDRFLKRVWRSVGSYLMTLSSINDLMQNIKCLYTCMGKQIKQCYTPHTVSIPLQGLHTGYTPIP